MSIIHATSHDFLPSDLEVESITMILYRRDIPVLWVLGVIWSVPIYHYRFLFCTGMMLVWIIPCDGRSAREWCPLNMCLLGPEAISLWYYEPLQLLGVLEYPPPGEVIY
jgi:hypothetical protein